jgi:hypothetical protein
VEKHIRSRAALAAQAADLEGEAAYRRRYRERGVRLHGSEPWQIRKLEQRAAALRARAEA